MVVMKHLNFCLKAIRCLRVLLKQGRDLEPYLNFMEDYLLEEKRKSSPKYKEDKGKQLLGVAKSILSEKIEESMTEISIGFTEGAGEIKNGYHIRVDISLLKDRF